MTKPAAKVTNSGGASTKATITPLATPISTAMTRATITAQQTGVPRWISISATDQEPAMMATSLRSIPRLMTINPMPRPRMPRMEMLRTRFSKLARLEKPGSVMLKTTSSASVISRMICSCDGFLTSCDSSDAGWLRCSAVDASIAIAIAPPQIIVSLPHPGRAVSSALATLSHERGFCQPAPRC